MKLSSSELEFQFLKLEEWGRQITKGPPKLGPFDKAGTSDIRSLKAQVRTRPKVIPQRQVKLSASNLGT